MNTQLNISSCNASIDKRPVDISIDNSTPKPEGAAHVLAEYQVCEWMQTQVITVNPELRVERVWEKMAKHGVRHLPVVKDGILVGIVTERDLKRAVFARVGTSESLHTGTLPPTNNPGDYPAEAIMTRRVSVVAPAENLQTVALRMLRDRVGALPVVSGNGTLVGIFTLSDLVRAVLAGSERPPVKIAVSSILSPSALSPEGVSGWDMQQQPCSSS